MKVDDIISVNNLKHAWKFILENIDYPTDYPFICEINRKVGGDMKKAKGFLYNNCIDGINFK